VKAPRARSRRGETLERAWWREFEELKAAYAAQLPPAPDRKRNPREYVEWAQKYGWREQPAEWQQLMDRMHSSLPRLKYRRDRDDKIWSWIFLLLVRHKQGKSPHDIRTCKLGANPTNGNAQPSPVLRALVATVAEMHPEVEPARLFDAIRNWRKSQRSVSTI
jgi:hypothetical protein